MTPSIQPSITEETRREFLALPPGASYFYGAAGAEDRAIVGNEWLQEQSGRGVSLTAMVSETREDITLQMFDGSTLKVSLFDQKQIQDFLRTLQQPLYLDITAMAFGSWAALLRAAILSDVDLKILYVEPQDYVRSVSPIGNLKYDLSDRTQGIAPLPGFARLTGRQSTNQKVLVPLLGFEGDRLARVLAEVEPASDATYPVVGLPGFRPEYTFHSLESNIRYLDEQRSIANLRYSRANCPFGVYYLLTQLADFFPKKLIQVAVLGTKPHALGAALFAIARPLQASLLYDHPIRSQRRTSGSGRICVYDINKFSKFTQIFPQ